MITETILAQMAKTIKYVEPVPYGSATGLTAEVYQQMQADFMPAPLLSLHSPVPEVLAGVWSILRETLLAGQVDRAFKEAVAVTVSKINECPFCVDAHTVMLQATSNHDVAGAILRGDYDGIHNPQLHAIVQWVLANRTPHENGLLPPPFSQNEAPEVNGTAITFHYLNRMANVFLGDTLLPLPSAVKGLTYRLYAATAGQRLVRRQQQGNSLQFVPQAKLPDDLSWAAANPAVAGAFAGFAEVVEEAGKRALPELVRFLVNERVQAWNGELMGISRGWVEEAVVELKAEHRTAARLALLTALASYQVDSSIVEDFQSQYPGDAQLIAATAWASFTAARRASVWLATPLAMVGRQR
jgi:AhpD family alkylhydroperoxidase